MNKRLKSFLLWILAFILTVSAAIYQRTTGPSYEVRGEITIGDQLITYKLIRTYDGEDDARIKIKVPDSLIEGWIKYRRYKSYDEWTVSPMKRDRDYLTGYLPHQEMAGKVMYLITLNKLGKEYHLTDKEVILRYKGFVPRDILWTHIIIIFLAMLFSTRVAFEVIFKGKYTYLYSWMTVIALLIGGMILGPIVQKYAFGAYWTGWPIGHDLTDNKSLVAFVFWVIALLVQIRKHDRKTWALIASIVLLIVYLIPHSVLGSEIDYTKQTTPTEQTE